MTKPGFNVAETPDYIVELQLDAIEAIVEPGEFLAKKIKNVLLCHGGNIALI
jgi:hypothetical protein